ncbi:Asp/Glu/hydantoin racemase [Amycolatopsis acidicola]|uniref:Asp/Glu/hydantoin racemase n=1 Tax=Amycolatopsis acidicola TaxID=2596893 RepID=A0A5N0VI52_9PSEU|nr:aspartate/glutamate racemase family protein [Amycolatopsis acidicola]KAA9165845.1 Asp/Glu/hydantoin racemase [Amycolatopsis acidicola]
MRFLVVNCNTSREITRVIEANAMAAAREGTEIVAIEPAWGPESAEGFYESFVTAAAVLDTVLTYDGPFDAVVMAGYGEHGREGMRQVLEVPVVDITEASAQFACLVSHRFGVATTAPAATAGIEDSLRGAGLWSRCAGVLATRVPVLGIHQDNELTLDALVETGRALLDLGADSVVLGCAGFAGLDRRLEDVLGVPVLDGVACAVAAAEGLVGLGKTTSKHGPFRPPDPAKTWTHWPRALAGKNVGARTMATDRSSP